MSRYDNPFVPRTGYGLNSAANTINLAQAGTRQFAPDLANLASNTPLVTRNIVPFLIEAPRFFRYAPNSSQLVRSLKAWVENHVRTIDGLQQGHQTDQGEAPVGGSGERIQTLTNVTRQVSNPSFGCWELQGRSIQKFLRWWITYGGADENTKIPRIVADGLIDASKYDQTFMGATILFVEPDPTFQDVVSAWLGTNMWPMNNGQWEGRKDASQIGQTLDLNIEMTALMDTSEAVVSYAREVMQSLNVGGLNPNETRMWTEGISADVRAADMGIESQLQEGARQRIVMS